jgi:hypothetical protein
VVKLSQDFTESVGALRIEGVSEPYERLRARTTQTRGIAWQWVLTASGWVVAFVMLLLNAFINRSAP